MRRPTLSKRHARYGWIALGAALLLTLGFVAYTYIGTLVVALFFYYTTRPFYRKIRQRVDQPTIAALAAIFIITLPVVLLIGYTVSIGLREVQRFESSYDLGLIEQYFGESGPLPSIELISRTLQSPQEAFTQGLDAETIQAILSAILQSVEFVGTVALHLFIILVFTFYLLRDGHRIRRYLSTQFPYEGSAAQRFIKEVDYDFHKVFFGNILNAVVTGIIAAISFSLIELIAPGSYTLAYPVLIGLLCGIASLIPVVGMKLVYVPVATYLFVLMGLNGDLSTLWWFPITFLGISAVIVDAIPDFFLRPYISGQNLHVGSLMLAYIIGPILFGWYGLFLGPVIVVLVIEFARIVLPTITAERLPLLETDNQPTNQQSGSQSGSQSNQQSGSQSGSQSNQQSGSQASNTTTNQSSTTGSGSNTPSSPSDLSTSSNDTNDDA